MNAASRLLIAVFITLFIAGCGHKAPPVWDIPVNLPAPESIYAIYSDGGVTISWDYPSEAARHVSAFSVSVYNGPALVRTVTVKGNEYKDADGGKYSYSVSSLGSHKSSQSLATDIIRMPQDGSTLMASTGVIASMTLDGLSLRWDQVKGAAGYSVYRKVSGQKNYKKLTRKPLKSAKYIDRGFVALGKDVLYQVRASGMSSISEGSVYDEGAAPVPFEATTQLLIPIAPEGLELTSSAGSVLLYWTEHPDYWASQYRVYRSKDGGEFVGMALTLTPAYVDNAAGEGINAYRVHYVGPSGAEGPGSSVVRVSLPEGTVIK